MKQLDRESHEVDDSLSLRVSRGPQFQILDAVVGAVPVAMMNHLVWEERATKVDGHYQTMFSHFGYASNEPTELRRDRDLSVSMAYVAVPIAFPDRPIRQRIAMGQEALVVGGAVALRLVRSIAAVDRAQSSRLSQRSLVGLSNPE